MEMSNFKVLLEVIDVVPSELKWKRTIISTKPAAEIVWGCVSAHGVWNLTVMEPLELKGTQRF